MPIDPTEFNLVPGEPPNPAAVLADLERTERHLAVIHDKAGEVLTTLTTKVAAVTRLGRSLRDAEVELERFQQFHVAIVKVLDDVHRAIGGAIQAVDPNPFNQGVLLIRDNFSAALRTAGIERMHVAAGDVFSPHIHEAIGTDDLTPKGVIAAISSYGYVYISGLFTGRLVRAAQVVVGSLDLAPAAATGA